jgi:hypothetical protein
MSFIYLFIYKRNAQLTTPEHYTAAELLDSSGYREQNTLKHMASSKI